MKVGTKNLESLSHPTVQLHDPIFIGFLKVSATFSLQDLLQLIAPVE